MASVGRVSDGNLRGPRALWILLYMLLFPSSVEVKAEAQSNVWRWVVAGRSRPPSVNFPGYGTALVGATTLMQSLLLVGE